MTTCNLCGKDFSDETMLRVHSNREHRGKQNGAIKPGSGGASKPGSGRASFSHVAVSTNTGESACPKCHGTSFTAKRSVKGKVLFGVLAPKTQVRCVTCGTMYKRK